jgi:hypothetical protein
MKTQCEIRNPHSFAVPEQMPSILPALDKAARRNA